MGRRGRTAKNARSADVVLHRIRPRLRVADHRGVLHRMLLLIEERARVRRRFGQLKDGEMRYVGHRGSGTWLWRQHAEVIAAARQAL